jgi:serine phosphatase RsbU (regulator of sigma subunit)
MIATMPFMAWRRHPAWYLVGRPLFFAIPFALFFVVMNGGKLHELHLYYVATLVYSLYVNSAVEANRAWVLPRIRGRHTDATRLPVASIASFALASVVASMAASVTLHFTLMPGLLGSRGAWIQVTVWALLFTALFLSFIYAMRFQRRYVDQLRAEAERVVREEQEMRLAAEIQQALLPPRTRSDTWYAIAGAAIPCRTIGGDFFEYFALPDDRVGFALADVAGKGPSAALLAAMVQGIFDAHARRGEGPARTMRGVNEAVAAREVEARFATVFYGVLSADGNLVCCNAGHNPPLVVRGGDVVRRLEIGGLLIGPFKEAQFEDDTSRLEPGDSIVVYSDGVTDAEDERGEQFGEDRLLECLRGPSLRSAEAIRDRLLDAVRAFTGVRPPADDITVMVVCYLGPPRANRPTS